MPMTAEQQAVYTNIIVPAFLEKCASRGRTFSPESLETHLENAAMVQMHKEAAEGDITKKANLALKESLGLVEQAQAQANDTEVKTAAARVLANPELKKLLS